MNQITKSLQQIGDTILKGKKKRLIFLAAHCNVGNIHVPIMMTNLFGQSKTQKKLPWIFSSLFPACFLVPCRKRKTQIWNLRQKHGQLELQLHVLSSCQKIQLGDDVEGKVINTGFGSRAENQVGSPSPVALQCLGFLSQDSFSRMLGLIKLQPEKAN